MDVLIHEKNSKKCIATYDINVRGLDYHASPEEFYSEAWKYAVMNGEVKADKRDDYNKL